MGKHLLEDVTLDASHRCDTQACNARAYIRGYSLSTGYELLFCAHHGQEAMGNPKADRFAWEDQAYQLGG